MDVLLFKIVMADFYSVSLVPAVIFAITAGLR